jgi:hypothetical protein
MEIAWNKLIVILGMVAFVAIVVLLQKVGRKKPPATAQPVAPETPAESASPHPPPSASSGQRRKAA